MTNREVIGEMMNIIFLAQERTKREGVNKAAVKTEIEMLERSIAALTLTKDEEVDAVVKLLKISMEVARMNKNLSEYKWVKDMIDKIQEEPEEEQEQAVLDFMRKKVEEHGNSQD